MQHTTAIQDHAKKPALSVNELDNFLDEISEQPNWRAEADRAADYYDGKQLEADHIREAKERGLAPLIRNMIAPAVDGVLGLEAKTRADWLVTGDSEDSVELAEGLNAKLFEAAELTYANRFCSDAHAAQVKTGLGWVEVNRNTNPFDYPYRVNYIHRRHISWDWHSKRPDLKDARWLLRDMWVDADKALLAFPQHEALINNAMRAWHNWDYNIDHDAGSPNLNKGFEDFQNTDMANSHWLDSTRDLARVYECWYRVYEKGVALVMPEGRTVKFDPKNMVHQAASRQRGARLVRATFPVMRLAYFLGPHRVADMPSPLPHDMFPYIPFWGFREDRTGIPYGIIRRMISPQDEINARLSKMMWLLSAKRVIMDEDATKMSTEEVADEVQRPDAVIIQDPDRQNKDQHAIRIEQDFTLAAQQFQVLQSAQDAVHEASGISQAMLGQVDSDQSGVAISSLIEQSSTSLAELMDNYRYSRQLVGEHLLALITHDIGEKRTEVAVNVNKPQKTKHIVLNDRVLGDDGVARINNDVVRTKMKVSLGDIQSTAGYRNQVFNRLTELTMTLPDEMKAGIMDLVFEMADIPQKDELVKRMQEITGRNVNPEDMTEEEREARKAQQAEAQKLKEQEFQAKQSEIEERMAKVEEIKSKARSNQVDDRKTAAETEKLLQEMQALTQQVDELRTGMVKEQEDRVKYDEASFEAQNLLDSLVALDQTGKPPQQPQATH